MYDFPRTVSTSSPLGRISTGKQPARKVRFTPHFSHVLRPVTRTDMSLCSIMKTNMQMLNFIPNVLVSGCGLIGAGGHQAEFALRSSDVHSQWSIQMRVGRSINNSASISPHPFHPLSIPRIHVSNNDMCVYNYDVHWPKR